MQRQFACNVRSKLSVAELLTELPLLHQSTRITGWEEWFALSGVSSPLVNNGPRFDLLSMLIAAVRSNLGVALLPRFAIQHDLDSGDMVIPVMCLFVPVIVLL